MILNQSFEVYKGSQKVKMLAVGGKIIWKKDAFLKVSPDSIWLMDSNNYQADVQIISNVKWNVK